MSDQRPLYDSRAVPERDFLAADWIGWDWLPPRQGMIYLRRHISGDEAPSGEWQACQALCPPR